MPCKRKGCPCNHSLKDISQTCFHINMVETTDNPTRERTGAKKDLGFEHCDWRVAEGAGMEV